MAETLSAPPRRFLPHGVARLRSAAALPEVTTILLIDGAAIAKRKTVPQAGRKDEDRGGIDHVGPVLRAYYQDVAAGDDVAEAGELTPGHGSRRARDIDGDGGARADRSCDGEGGGRRAGRCRGHLAEVSGPGEVDGGGVDGVGLVLGSEDQHAVADQDIGEAGELSPAS